MPACIRDADRQSTVYSRDTSDSSAMLKCDKNYDYFMKKFFMKKMTSKSIDRLNFRVCILTRPGVK